MKFTLGQAARETGHAKSTIHRDIKSGKISATKLENGSYEIDSSELFRVYPPVSLEPSRNDSENGSEAGVGTHGNAGGTGVLHVEIERLGELLRNANLERERERRQLSDVIEDLRTRLDREGEERRAMTQRLLAYQPLPAVTPPVVPPAPPPDSPQPPLEQTAPAAVTPPRSGLFSFFRRRS